MARNRDRANDAKDPAGAGRETAPATPIKDRVMPESSQQTPMKTFQNGDTVYSLHGEAGRYLMPMSNGHLVSPLFEDGEGCYYEDNPVTWKQVFAQPPTAVLEAAVQELETKKEGLTKALAELRKQVSDAQRKTNDQLAALAKYEPLKLVEDYLNGNITHLVLHGGFHGNVVTIQPINECRDDDAEEENEGGYFKKPIRLLCLYGSQTKRYGLEWKMHRYSRGYDDHPCSVYPCLSEEDAIAKAHSLMAEILPKFSTNPLHLEGVIKNAKAINFPVPQELIDGLRDYKRKQQVDSVDRCQKSLEEAQAKLAAFEVEQCKSEEVAA